MSNFFDQFDPAEGGTGENFFDKFDEGKQETSNPLRRLVADPLISATKGAIGLPEAVVGLQDIVSGGHVGKFLEDTVGYRPKEAKEFLDTLYSPEQQRANKAVQEADGFVDTMGNIAEYPSVIPHSIIESLAVMGGGSMAARGIGKALPYLGKTAGRVLGSGKVRGAVGEGVMGAGSAAEQMRQESTDGLTSGTQNALAALSGVGTTLFGLVGAKRANKLHIGDVDTMFAGGEMKASTEGAKKLGKMAYAKAGVLGGLSEGAFEELPQSVWEQAIQNIAMGRPFDEGLGNAAAMGLVTGTAMGAGGGLLGEYGDRTAAARQKILDDIQAKINKKIALSAAENAMTQAIARQQVLAEEEQGIPPSAPPPPPVSGWGSGNPMNAFAPLSEEAQSILDAEAADNETIFMTGRYDQPEIPVVGPISAAANLAVKSGAAAQIVPPEQIQYKSVSEEKKEGTFGNGSTGNVEIHYHADGSFTVMAGTAKRSTGSTFPAGTDVNQAVKTVTNSYGGFTASGPTETKTTVETKKAESIPATPTVIPKPDTEPDKKQVPANPLSAMAQTEIFGKDKFDPQGKQPGTPEYDAAYEAWAKERDEQRQADEVKRRYDEDSKAVAQRNTWRKKVRDWFDAAEEGDTITDTATGTSYAVFARTRGNGDVVKSLVIVDDNGKPLPDGRGALGIQKKNNDIYGLNDTTFDENGIPNLEHSSQALASSLGRLLETGEVVTGKAKKAPAEKPATPPVVAEAEKEAPTPQPAENEAVYRPLIERLIRNKRSAKQLGFDIDGAIAKAKEAMNGKKQMPGVFRKLANKAERLGDTETAAILRQIADLNDARKTPKKAEDVPAKDAQESTEAPEVGDDKGNEEAPPEAPEIPEGTAPEHVHNKGKPLNKDEKYDKTAPVLTTMFGAVDDGLVPITMRPEDFAEIYDEFGEIFSDPKEGKINISKKAGEFLTPEEAKAKIEEWKEHAKQQGENNRSENSEKTVISLFDLTGEWSKPWREAGYNVLTFDIQNGQDIHDFSVEYFTENYDITEVYAILAACPCTDFASSGARWFAEKDADGRTEASKELVFQTMRTIEYFRPAIWALENPVGRIANLTGLPTARVSFDPNNFGDPYTKKTMLYGNFNGDLPTANVDPVEGSKMWSKYGGKSLETKNARSATPEGFAYSFFMANNYIDMPVEQKLVVQYPEVAGAIRQALKAGITEERIHELMYDTYGNYEYDDARNALVEEVANAVGEKTEESEPESKEETQPENKDKKPENPADSTRDERSKKSNPQLIKNNKSIEDEHNLTIDDAANEAATSPNNDTPEPTPAQIEAGNYKKGHISISGLDISIENPAGSTRSGTDEDGKEWSNTLSHHYGYIKRTEGNDGDQVDVFIGTNPESQQVFIVDQRNPKTGAFDEHKVMMGFDDLKSAKAGYLKNYEKGWAFKGVMAVSSLSMDEFKAWLKEGDTTKPYSGVTTEKAHENNTSPDKSVTSGTQSDKKQEYKPPTLLEARNHLIELQTELKNQGRVADARLMDRISRQVKLIKELEEDQKKEQEKPAIPEKTSTEKHVKRYERDVHVAIRADAGLVSVAGTATQEEFTRAAEKAIVERVKDLLKDAATPEEKAALAALVVDGRPVLPESFFSATYKTMKKQWDNAQKEAARDPLVYQDELARQLDKENIEAGSEEAERFKTGFDHALRGQAKSTLPSDYPEFGAGYAAAKAWAKTETGSAWFEGKKIEKQKNTGVVLQRWWDRRRNDIEKIDKVDIEAWEALLKATTRADFFPMELADDATPGAKEVIENLRASVSTFKEFFWQEATGSHSSWTKFRKPIDLFIGKASPFSGRLSGEDAKSPEKRLEIVKSIAREYQEKLTAFSSKFKGVKTLEDIEAIVDETFLPNGRPGKGEARTAWMTLPYFIENSALFYPNIKSLQNALPLPTEYEWNEKYSFWYRAKETENKDRSKPTRKTSLIRPRLDKIIRMGLENKRNGKNVTSQEFKETFGFADVVIGQYVTAQQGQDHLNYAYDALMTLAELTGAKPKQLSFGGKLYFAIGALGNGKYAAHFQSQQQVTIKGEKVIVPVINVTATRGDGTVLHEYFHAIDFLTTDPALKRTITGIKQLLMQTPQSEDSVEDIAKSFLSGSRYVVYGKRKSRDSRVDQAIQALKAFYRDSYRYDRDTDFYANAKKLDNGSSKPYWSNDFEPFARIAESWGFDKLLGNNQNDNYLVSDFVSDGYATKNNGYRGTPYPESDERIRLNGIFAKFIGEIEWTDQGPKLKESSPWQNTDPYTEARRPFVDAVNKAIENIEAIEANRIKMEEDEEKQLEEANRKAKEDRERNESLKNDVFDQDKTTAPVEDSMPDDNQKEDEPPPAVEEKKDNDPPLINEPPVSDDVGMSEDELSAIFDEEADALREERQEKPSTPEPGENLLPKAANFTREDYEFFASLLNVGKAVLTAQEGIIPTIHSIKGAEHLGYGLFRVNGDGWQGTFDGGSAMPSSPSGQPYTVLAYKGNLPKEVYDVDEVKRKIQGKLLAKSGPRAAPTLVDEQQKTVEKLAAEMAQYGVTGINEALSGLVAIFGGGKGKLQSFPGGFDEDSYKAAKPHFIAAAEAFGKAGMAFKDFIRAFFRHLISQFGDGVKPYAVRFAKDYEAEFMAKAQDSKKDSASSDKSANVDVETSTKGDGNGQDSTEQSDSTLEGVASDDVREPQGEQHTDESVGAGSGESGEGDSGTDGDRGKKGRGRGNSSSEVHPTKTRGKSGGGGGRGRKPGRSGKDVRGTDSRGKGEDGSGGTDEKEVAPAEIPAENFVITDDVNLGSGGQMTKYRDNIAAIITLKKIESERRRATDAEKKVLARYVGWGGIPNAFRNQITKEAHKDWIKEVDELEGLLTPQELKAASASVRNAHYTSKDVIDFMWGVVKKSGFTGGMVLEPSVGTGNFIGLTPSDLMGNCATIGVELDSLTSRIASALYPQSSIINSGIQDVALPSNKFDLVIGNPPFGSESLRFKHTSAMTGASIHNQFFLAGMEALKPGGIMAMVVSRYLMDAKDASTREKLAIHGNLLGAVRLPGSAFKGNALTEVVTDILFFQKRDAEQIEMLTNAYSNRSKIINDKKVPPQELLKLRQAREELEIALRWTKTGLVKDPLNGPPMEVSQYFVDRPGLIVGTMDRSGTMRTDGDIGVKLENGEKLSDKLNEMLSRMKQQEPNQRSEEVRKNTERYYKSLSDSLRLSAEGNEADSVFFDGQGKLCTIVEKEGDNGEIIIAKIEITPETPWSSGITMDADGNWGEEVVKTNLDGSKVKNGRFNVYERKVYKSVSEISKSRLIGESRYQKLKMLVTLRDLFKHQISLEVGRDESGQMEKNRKKLRDAYNEFVNKHGYINDPVNAEIISDMPDEGLLLSLESDYKKAVSPLKAKALGIKASPSKASPSAILSRPVAVPPAEATKADSIVDAMAISLSETGKIDVDRIAKLRGSTVEAVTEELTSGEKPLAFKDPENSGTLVDRNAYLGGNVRRKLQAARASGLAANIRELEAVQPELWTSDKITAKLASNWIPDGIYSDFLTFLTGKPATVKYSLLTNAFDVTGDERSVASTSTWGTAEISATKILSNLLNSQKISITSEMPDGSRRGNEEATDLAVEKGKAITEAFNEWIFNDADRRAMLTELFNNLFNVRVRTQYDGSHMMFPGKVPDEIIKLRRGQVNAVWRGIVERFVLYDHAVGAGKTYVGIARAMERRRMGLSKKPMIVVPNHMVGEWAAQAYRLYPGAKILAATKKDLASKSRRRLFAKIASGDWDLVIVPHSSFGFISISKESEERLLTSELNMATEALLIARKEAGPNQWGKPLSVKEAEALVNKISSRIDGLRNRKSDKLLTFEQMGVDDLTVDESHEFKNLFYSSSLTDVRGMGNKTGSSKATDMYLKTQIVRESGGSVAFMTGTPISNSAVEMYTILRYLAPELLKESKQEHFDAFRAQYVDYHAKFEPNDAGDGIKMVNRLGRSWTNMRSLMENYYSVADVVTNEDIKRWFAEDNPGKEFPLPKVKTGQRIAISVKPTETQLSILKSVIQGFGMLDMIKDTKERNAEHLRLMDRARKLSLHAKAVNPRLNDEEGGKLDVASDNIAKIYREWDADKGTQLVFLDRGVPKAKGDDKIIKEYDALRAKITEAVKKNDDDELMRLTEALEKYDPIEIEELKAAQENPWSAYQHIKDRLIKNGIPANEIAFIQDYPTDDKKQQIFEAVRNGTVRVLIGSTQRMGAGTNVQDLLVALHHIDATWKPSDIEQREGRIIRQGNLLYEKYKKAGKLFEVGIYAYVTERTVDAKLWELNSTKLRMVNAIRYYKGEFEMDFDDESAIGMAEIAAIASGDPLLLERFKLISEIEALERSRSAHRRRVDAAEDTLRSHMKKIESAPMLAKEGDEINESIDEIDRIIKESISKRSVTINETEYKFDEITQAKKDIEQIFIDNEKDFEVTIDGKEYKSPTSASEAVSKALGDVEVFVAEIDGKTFYRRSEYVREVRKITGSTFDKTTKGIDIGKIFGVPVKFYFDFDKYGADVDIISSGVFKSTGRNNTVVATDYNTYAGNVKPEKFEVPHTSVRNAVTLFEHKIRQRAKGSRIVLFEAENLQKEIPDLEKNVSEPFKGKEQLAEKKARLATVEGVLAARDEAKKANNAQKKQANEIDESDEDQRDGLGSLAIDGKISPSDKAVYGMVAEGKSLNEVLSFIASSSRKPFYRQLARLLLKTGITTAIQVGTDKGWKFNAGNDKKYAAAYDPKSDTAVLFRPAAAERNILHELVHAATLKALNSGKGLASAQMKALFKHVKASGKLNGMYGMTNVDEFVTEAFTNPKFQQALKRVSAPVHSKGLAGAWEWFVRVVRGILGLKREDESALAAAIELGVGVMRENMNEVKRKTGAFSSDETDSDIRYNLTEQASNQLYDLFHSDNKFNFLHKSVATQFHKATVDKDFKKVFDLGQKYLLDNSRFAMDAADMAPSMLQKIGSLSDVFKKGPKRADVEAIADPIFKGTLDNKRYTEAELRKEFDLSDDQIKLYNEFRNTVDASLDTLGVSEMVRIAKAHIDQDMIERVKSVSLEVASGMIQKVLTDKGTKATNQLAKDVRAKEARIKQLKDQGYAPLMRFGNYAVDVVETDAKGKENRRYFGMYESQREANRAARELAIEFPKAKITKGPMDTESWKLFSGVDPSSLEVFAEAVGASDKEIFQDYLRLTINNRSAMKRMIHRNGTAGFSKDIARILSQFVTSNARLSAKNYHFGDMKQAVLDIPKMRGDVKNEAAKLVDYLQNPKEELAPFRSYLFVHFLGGSIASALTNMTQPITMTLPYLSQFGGAAKAGKALVDAGKLYASGKFDPDLELAMKLAEREGITSPHEIHQLYAESERGLGRNIAVRKGLRVWGSFFSLAEAFNRNISFIAAYNMARENGEKDPFSVAQLAVEATQGIYNKGNRPDWARGSIGATVFTFKQFSISYIEFLSRLYKNDKKAFALAMAIMFVGAGAEGWPFAEDVEDLFDTIGQLFGFATNSKKWLRTNARNVFGEMGGEFMLKGMSALPGMPIDISSRVGVSNLIPGSGIFKVSEQNKENSIFEAIGPIGGFAQSAIKGFNAVRNNDIDGAIRLAAPLAVQNLAKGVDMLHSGAYRDQRGRKVIETTPADAFAKAIGFQPNTVAKESRLVHEMHQDITHQRTIKAEIADKWAGGIFDRDMEKVESAKADLRAWNAKNPEAKIVIAPNQIASRLKAMRETRAQRFIKSAPKEMRGQVSRELHQ